VPLQPSMTKRLSQPGQPPLPKWWAFLEDAYFASNYAVYLWTGPVVVSMPNNTLKPMELLRHYHLVGAVTILPKAAFTSLLTGQKADPLQIWRNFTSVNLISSNQVCGSL
jgi:hypothetical protein